jgi:predicted kinase
MTWQEKLLNLEPINLLDYKDVPEFKLLSECIQDTEWHAEGDVLIHTNMVLEKAREIATKEFSNRPFDKIAFYFGCLLHDFGKPATTFKNEKTGHIVAYGHENVGVGPARDFLRKYFPQFDTHLRESILSLVEYHGHPKRMVKTESNTKRYFQLSCEVNTELVYWLEVADFTGRIGISNESALVSLEQFKKNCKDMGIWGTKFMTENKSKQWAILFGNEKQIKPLKDQELVITIGAPASGKTTFLKERFPDYKFISMDDERLKLCGTMADMSRNEEVYNNCFRELANNIKANKNCVWDATSITRKLRRRLIQLGRSSGTKITVVYFDLPLEELFLRNNKRDRHVPEDVITRFYRNLQSPKDYEYDELIVVTEK